MRGTFWVRKKVPEGVFGTWCIVLKGSCVGVFDDNDNDDDEESGLGSNKWPLGSVTFPRDLRHYSLQGTYARARARCLYGKKRLDPLTTGCIIFYFESAIGFSQNSSDTRGNAL